MDAAFKLAEAEYITIETALSMTRYISKEKHLLGIFALDLHIFEIGERLNRRPGYDVFKVCSVQLSFIIMINLCSLCNVICKLVFHVSVALCISL